MNVRTRRPSRGRPRSARPQRGVALAVALVLLAAMTVVGVATLSGTRLNEKITSNAQQKSVAFEVAESAIDTVWSAAGLIGSIGAVPADRFDAPEAVVPEGVAAGLSRDFDQTRGERSTLDIEGSVSIRYCGESRLPEGSSLDADESAVALAAALFDVNGVATIAGSATRADHVQRGSLVRPRTGRGGACTVPGD